MATWSNDADHLGPTELRAMRERVEQLQATGLSESKAWWFAYREEAWRQAHPEPEDEEQDGQ